MLRINRALIMSVSAASLGWIAAGIATFWVILDPNLHYASVYLMWLHSAAIVATMSAMALLALRAFKRMIGETRQAYALGLEHGIDIMSSIRAHDLDSLNTASQQGLETRAAPAAAGASCMGSTRRLPAA